MRDYKMEVKRRIAFIRDVMHSAGAGGLVYGNSGGKDSALVGILCKMAWDDTVGLLMPCGSKQNYETDLTDARTVAEQFGIAMRVIDLSEAKNELVRIIGAETPLGDAARANMSPRLRMIALYAVAASENRLVAGTGNRSEGYMGYFTKWGDGAYDFNPIADLTVMEIYEFLRHLNAPDRIISKAPSAGLFDGQTDEGEMGIAYHSIDAFLLTGVVNHDDREVIEKFHKASEHKRRLPIAFG